jgi:O-antigen/teichoic acid export membrane protein
LRKELANHQNCRILDLKKNTLLKNISVFFAGNLVLAAAQWLILILLTKFNNQPATLGEYVLVVSMATPIFVIVTIQMRTIIVTSSDAMEKVAIYFSLRFKLAVLGLVAGLVWGIINQFSAYSLMVLLLYFSIKAIESFSDLLHAYLQKAHQFATISLAQTIRGIGLLVGFGVSIFLPNALHVYLIIVLGFTIAIFCFIELKAFLIVINWPNKGILHVFLHALKRVTQQIKPGKPELQLLYACIPLGVMMGLNAFIPNLPRYELQDDKVKLSVFGALSYFLLISNLVTSAIGETARPSMATCYQQQSPKGFLSIFKRIMVLGNLYGLVFLAIALLGAKTILVLCFNQSYANYTTEFIIIVLGCWMAGIYSLFLFSITAMQAFRQLLVGVVVVFVATFVLGRILIHHYDIAGAAYTLTAANALLMVVTGLQFWWLFSKWKTNTKS